LNGSETDVWVFQVAQDLTMASATNVILTGGAQAQNIFWQVSGVVFLDTTAHFEGVVLGQTEITLATGASINGRMLAQTAVNLDTAVVVASSTPQSKLPSVMQLEPRLGSGSDPTGCSARSAREAWGPFTWLSGRMRSTENESP
jgi:hypothetical protein